MHWAGKRNLSKGDLRLWEGSSSGQRATSIASSSSQVIHSLPESSVWKVVRPVFLPPWGTALPEPPTWTIRNLTLEEKKVYSMGQSPCRTQRVWQWWGKRWRAKGGLCCTCQCISQLDLLWGYVVSTQGKGNGGQHDGSGRNMYSGKNSMAILLAVCYLGSHIHFSACAEPL